MIERVKSLFLHWRQFVTKKKTNILLEAFWPLDIKEKLWKTTQNNVIDIESSGLGFKWLLDQMYYFC